MSIKKSGHEILKGLFGDEKIAELEKRDDFIELKKKAEKLQADNLMDDLSSKINQNVDNFETKINMLKDFEHKDIIDSAKQKVWDIKDSVTDNVDEKVEEIKESLWSKAVAKLEAAVTKERWAISWAIVWTLGWFLVNMFKWKKGEKKGGIWGLFTKVALTLWLAVLGAFAWKKLMDKYWKDFKGVLQSGENSDDETDTPWNEEAPVKTQTKLAKKSTLSSNNAVRNATESVASLDNNNDKIEYKEKLWKWYQSVGFTLLNNLSWVNFDEQSSSAWLLQEIWTMSYAKLKVVMDDASRAYLWDWKDLDSTHLQRVLREELGLGEEYSGKLIFKTLQSIFSPFTEFIYTDRLALDSILPHLFWKNDDFTEKAIKILSPEELENIRQSWILSWQNHYYKILAMWTVSKLIALSFQSWSTIKTFSSWMRYEVLMKRRCS